MPHRRVPPCRCGKGRLGHEGYDENAGCGLEGGSFPNFDQRPRTLPNRVGYNEEPLADRARREWVSPNFSFGVPIPAPGIQTASATTRRSSSTTPAQPVIYRSTAEEHSHPNYIIVSRLHRSDPRRSRTQTTDVITDTRASSSLTSCVHVPNCTCNKEAGSHGWDSATYDMLVYFVLLFTSIILLIDNARRGGMGAWASVASVMVLLMLGGEFVARFWDSRRR